MTEQVFVPDVGEADDVEVVEVLVAVGDVIELDASLVVLESDKASMEIPSPCAGKVVSISVAEGDKVEEGSLLIELETSDAGVTQAVDDRPDAGAGDADAEDDDTNVAAAVTAEPAQATEAPADTAASTQKIETSRVIPVPDVGDAQEVIVVEILVQQGEAIDEGASLVVLESDKASMEIPADFSGVVQEIFVQEGDAVKEGDPLVTLIGKVEPDQEPAVPTPEADKTEDVSPATEPAPASKKTGEAPATLERLPESSAADDVHAGPAVRKLAREFGVDLSSVRGSGRKARILKEDVQAFVKDSLGKGPAASGSGIPEIPEVDFGKWGDIEAVPLSRIRKASARNLHRSWLNVPHVTQFDEADITDLEAFRKAQNSELGADGVKLTPLAFLIRAVVSALAEYPRFNASLSGDYEQLILKKYVNIGIAVETEDGLVVPVIKDANTKGVIQLAAESAELAAQARDKKLSMDAMQGATFTISSLGGIGGTAFTPIVNAPEVAILGVSRTRVAPVYDGAEFVPRTMLPLSLSYDHRAIDGAEAARFTTYLSKVLTDIRRTIL